jgi:hypothetical protein
MTRSRAWKFVPILVVLAVNMPQSEPYWPKSIVPNGTGAY